MNLAVALNIFLGLSIAATTAAAQRRGTLPMRSGGPPRPTPVEDWPRIMGAGHRLAGTSSAPVTVVVFSDFQCRYCHFFATRVVPAISRQFKTEVTILFRHLPLEIHPQAYLGGRAGECAAHQGKFTAFHDAVFAEPSVLAAGVSALDRVAKSAGISNANAFGSCVRDTARVPAIESDLAEASRIGARATPTVIVNGLRYPGTPDSAVMARAITAALAARSPSR